MALGLLLRVSWMYLLFDCSAGSPATKGSRYPSQGDSRKRDEVLNSETFRPRASQASNDQLIDPGYTIVDAPSFDQLPGLVSLQNLPNTQSYSVIEELLNGNLRDWTAGNPERLLVFPLDRIYQPNNPENSQSDPLLAQYLLEDDASSAVPPSNTAGWSSQADYVSKGSSTSSPQKGSSPSSPANVGARPFYPSGMGSPSSWFSGGGNPGVGKNYQPQKTVVGPQKAVVTQRPSEPFHPRRPPSYIVQSRNGYQRSSYLNSNSRYSPDVRRLMPASSRG